MKRVLIISPGPFCKTDNDGQTLEDIFSGWDKNCIAQFYIQPLMADTQFCSRYFCISDKQVLCKLLGKKWYRNESPNFVKHKNNLKKIVKTPITLILRNILWEISPWDDGQLNKWIDSFAPEVLFFEIGDNTYMMKYVIRLKQKLKIPLIVHNTEGFYFFENCYMRTANHFSRLFYPIVHNNMKKWYRKVMENTDYALYSCEPLLEDFSKVYKIPSSVMYKSARISQAINCANNDPIKISYLGSLGLNRPLALINIADVISQIDPRISIDVYGKCDDNDRTRLLTHHNVNYKGFVSFEDVNLIIKTSDIILHTESESCSKDVLYGFSTKIPDSLGSGTCFYCHTPSNVAGSRYIKSVIPELVSSTNEELKEKITPLIKDPEYRKQMVKRCLELASRNHDKKVINKQFKQIINEL